MPTGTLVQIDCVRRTTYGYDERIEVHGSAAVAESRRERDDGIVRYGARTVVEDGLRAGSFERVRPTYAGATTMSLTSGRTERVTTA